MDFHGSQEIFDEALMTASENANEFVLKEFVVVVSKLCENEPIGRVEFVINEMLKHGELRINERKVGLNSTPGAQESR